MPGVFRPQNLTDVLQVINGQSAQSADSTINGIGYFGEDDETLVLTDAAGGLVQTLASQGWDSGAQWGLAGWS